MTSSPAFDIAIVGMACRFPGAPDLDAYWDLLRSGREGIRHFTVEELASAGISQRVLSDPSYVKSYGYLDGFDRFDARFFGYTPREAQLMDPQQRLFMECAWETLEHAGYDPERCNFPIGVYGGSGMEMYFLRNLISNQALVEDFGEYQIIIGNNKDSLPTRTSYKLDLKGPSIDVQTACSTSLVAMHLACQSLIAGETDMALAGGVSIVVTGSEGYFYTEDGIYSPDGHNRTFDARAAGMVGSDGVGLVALKRLEDARRDGDSIHAVIKSSATNNDGSSKVGFTAPSVVGQTKVILEALAIADIDPETISYIEAHGTATKLGDPIEFEALSKAFGRFTAKKNFCALGSVKSNIGHTNTAAGAASLIKTVLAMKHRQLPPSLHFENPNPAIDLENSPFYVNTRLRDWEQKAGPLRAGVSSFGIGGTNAHIILEEAPEPPKLPGQSGWQALTLSAKTSTALEKMTDNLVRHMENSPHAWGNITFTQNQGRHLLPFRRSLAAEDKSQAAGLLRSRDPGRVHTLQSEQKGTEVAFLFPGQGAQHINMGHGLYRSYPVFRDALDRCAEFLTPILEQDLKKIIYPDSDDGLSQEALTRTDITQPALFSISYALLQLWASWGVSPAALLGHSIGEFAAAYAAGVFSWEDTLRLVAERGRLMANMSPGAMLAVSSPLEKVVAMLPSSLSPAAVNEPGSVVISGPFEAIAEMEVYLKNAGIAFQRLRTSHAFHSTMMEPALEAFEQFVSGIERKAPSIPIISNVTGDWLTGEQAVDPAYWASQLRRPVQFSKGITKLLEAPNRSLLEVGPGTTLTTLSRLHLEPGSRNLPVASMGHPKEKTPDEQQIQTALGRLWANGVEIDWSKSTLAKELRRVPLPTYPFERKRYWIEKEARASRTGPDLSKKSDLEDWFYSFSWKRLPPLPPPDFEKPINWLIFADQGPLAGEISEALNHNGQKVAIVHISDSLVLNEKQMGIRPDSEDDYDALMAYLQKEGHQPDIVLHLFGLESSEEPGEHKLDLPFFSHLLAARSLGRTFLEHPISYTAITRGMHQVTGGDRVNPAAATALGPVEVIPFEYPQIRTLALDLDSAGKDHNAESLLAEVLGQSQGPIAFRGPYRWTRIFEPISLAGRQNNLLKQGGTYLVTGGLGGIGFALSSYLADRFSANLVLVNRSPVPSGDLRPKMLQEKGAEILLRNGDIADKKAIENIVIEAEDRFGTIDGVIHTAGVPGGGIIELKTTESAQVVLSPKVDGSRVLGEIFASREPDFIALCSSLASVMGGAGQADYCAANAYQDAYAEHMAAAGKKAVSILWDTWGDTGMAVDTAVPITLQAERDANLRLGILSEEGGEAFDHAINAALPQVLVSTRDLTARYSDYIGARNGRTQTAEDSDWPEDETEASTGDRPDLESSYAAPQNPVEEGIVAIWQKLFGIDQIGVLDDFFQLGGHSLLATQLLNKIRQSYPKAELSLRVLFENPTVQQLARLIREQHNTMAGVPGDQTITPEMVQRAGPDERPSIILAYLSDLLENSLGLKSISPAQKLDELDFGPVGTELFWEIKKDLGLPIYPEEIKGCPTLKDLVNFVSNQWDLYHGEMERPLPVLGNIRLPTPDFPSDAGITEKNPAMVFIHSAPRAGSTLLRIMLDAHPLLFSPPELALLAFDGLEKWRSNQREYYSENGYEIALMRLMSIEASEAREETDRMIRAGWSVQKAYKRLQDQAGPSMLVDKTPGYSSHTEILRRTETLFEGARYIHLYRHPYSVIESFARQRFQVVMGQKEADPYLLAETLWRRDLENTGSFYNSLPGDQWLSCSYESLLMDTEETLIKICAFLNIPFDTAMLAPYQNSRMIAGPGDPDIFLHNEIDPGLAESWKKVLLPWDLAPETVALARSLGYDLPAQELGVDAEKVPTPEHLLEHLEDLSDDEIDSLLGQILSDD